MMPASEEFRSVAQLADGEKEPGDIRFFYPAREQSPGTPRDLQVSCPVT